MATAKQIAANRENAKKSTGPKSQAGKNIVRMNAYKSGLTGQLIVLHEDQFESYAAFERDLMSSLAPVGIQELHVATRIMADTWRLNRAAANEANIYALGLAEIDPSELTSDPVRAAAFSDALVHIEKSRHFDRSSLYESRLKRGLHKDYELLHRLQKLRLSTKQTTSSEIGSVLTKKVVMPFGLDPNAQKGPIVVNSTTPYVNPWSQKQESVPQDPYWPY